LKESFLVIIIYSQVTVRPSFGRELIALVADDTFDTNVGFKQCVILWTMNFL